MSSGTRLYNAAFDGDMGAVRTLLNRPAGNVAGFINGQNEGGYTALHVGSSKGKLEIVRLLLKKGADIPTNEATNENKPRFCYLLKRISEKIS